MLASDSDQFQRVICVETATVITLFIALSIRRISGPEIVHPAPSHAAARRPLQNVEGRLVRSWKE